MKQLLCLGLFALSFDLFSCSIVGYVGDKPCKAFLLSSLSRLEYRGYDSAGIALADDEDLKILKSEGVLAKLTKRSNGKIGDALCGIGHTRWATHGKANEVNAHPHINNGGSLAIVHNGIIENFSSLKKKLKAKGCNFRSETDTEVVAHLIDSELKTSSTLQEAVLKTVNQLEGAFALLVVSKGKKEIVAARQGSPLCIGVGSGEYYVASDCLGFADKTQKVIYLPEKTVAYVTSYEAKVFDFDGKAVNVPAHDIDVKSDTFELTGYKHFMLKEIYEQPHAVANCIDMLDKDNILDSLKVDAKKLKSINIIGCGTSWHAARIAQFFFEQICKIPTRIYLASEFRYMPFFPEKNSLYIAISQSGETADTLEAVRMVNIHGLKTLAVTNVASSSMARECSGYLLARCGPEISVAATKSFTSQLTSLYYLSHLIANSKGLISEGQFENSKKEIKEAALILGNVLEQHKEKIEAHAKEYCNSERFIFLGRHIGYPFAMEAALKLKEISYIFALGLPAGELKHGSIALIDKKTPVMIFSHPDPNIYKKILSNAQEIKARHGHIISVAFEGQYELQKISNLSFEVPKVGSLLSTITMTGIMQLFIYQIANEIGCNIDKPRNLAKSVTVE